jgi:phosphoribosylaminoimidazolecarboxamide formyltransferase/IMP cyclohydrolase
VELHATGGTYRRLDEIFEGASFVKRVSDYTGQPELQGGLVKTLDYKLYLGLLADPENQAHRRDMERVGAEPIDLVVVNLYPFGQATSERPDDLETARDFIDIGGPTMLRAAAKRFDRVAAVCDPADYGLLLEELNRYGGTSRSLRLRLAQKVFSYTASYDAAIRDHLQRFVEGGPSGKG